jgi:hypothetical protein
MDIDKLKALALAATPQNFDSAQIKREGGWTDCPACGGDGTISIGNDYCNYDGSALGVQFYGIGDEHQRAEAYYRAANPASVLELIAEVERLRADAARYQHMRQAQWFKAGFAKTEANASAFHYCGELLDQLVDAAIEANIDATKEQA